MTVGIYIYTYVYKWRILTTKPPPPLHQTPPVTFPGALNDSSRPEGLSARLVTYGCANQTTFWSTPQGSHTNIFELNLCQLACASSVLASASSLSGSGMCSTCHTLAHRGHHTKSSSSVKVERLSVLGSAST